jgi:hypothetical protein
MEKQYCKIGEVKSLNNKEQSAVLVEYLYQNPMDKAGNIQKANTKLKEFVGSKAQKIQKLLKEL